MKIINSSSDKLVIKDPIAVFTTIIALPFILVGLFLIYQGFSAAPGSSWAAFLFGLFITLVGGYLFIQSLKVFTITLDRSLGKVSIAQKSIFGNRAREIPLNQISKIGFQEIVSRGKGGTTTSFELFFILSDGNKVPFDNRTVGAGAFTKVGEGVSAFLGVPFGRADDPTDILNKLGVNN